MIDLEVIDDPAAAVVALDPVRARLLAELVEPGSAASLAPRMGLARQKVNYHLRALEAHGLVRPVEERRWGAWSSADWSPPPRRSWSRWSWLTPRPARPGRRSHYAREEGCIRTSLRRSRDRSPRHAGRGLAGDRERTRDLRVVRPHPAGGSGRRRHRPRLRSGHGIGAVITTWDPPRRFVAENQGGMGPGSPTVADEWTIEAKSGGTCRVRVVHSWFASTHDWDGQFEGVEQGWPAFFRILRIYLAHFRGQPSEVIPLMAMSAESKAAVWVRLLGSLGLARLIEGQRVETAHGAPRLAGIVEWVVDKEHEELFLRLEEPTSGVAHFLPVVMGGQVCLSVRLYLYGAQAPAVAAREAPVWQAWINGLLPPADAPSESEATQA